jgi:D-sedoheptulose 7-phosphate isomerase
MSFARSYLAQTQQIASQLDTSVIERMAERIAAVRERGGRIFFLGVGGGAAHASHAVNDFRKLAGIECYAPTDNVAELTARINDDGWDDAFAAWLRGSRMTAHDAIFVFSVGGGNESARISVNIVNAVKFAKSVGATVLGVVGRDGGYTASQGDDVLSIPTVDPALVTPHTESFQAVVWHLLVSHPSVAMHATKWESLAASPTAGRRA